MLLRHLCAQQRIIIEQQRLIIEELHAMHFTLKAYLGFSLTTEQNKGAPDAL